MNQQQNTIWHRLRHPWPSKHDKYTRKDATDLTSLSVVIIGAGISGLAAAQLLCSKGFSDVTVVEGSDRIGGRICTTQLDNGPKLEMGAQYIHGSRKNPIYKFAEDNGIRLVGESDMYDDKFLTETGQVIPPSVAMDALGYCEALIDQSTSKKYLTNLPDHVTSVGHFLKWKINQKLSTVDSNEHKSLLASIYACREVIECTISACNSTLDLHLRDFGDYIELPGDDKEFKNGFSQVPQKVARKIPENIIHFNQRVEKITINNNNIAEDKNLIVECANGKVYKADIAICTVSLGVLKEEARNLFQPSLSEEKLKVIDRMGYGVTDKVFLRYSDPFWKKGNAASSYYFLWNGSDNQFLDIEKNGITLSPDEEWLRNISTIETVQLCPNTLVVWMSGESAKIMENLSERCISESITRILRIFTGISDLQEPDQVIQTKWFNNPLTRGSYSYISTSSCSNDVDVLAEPVLDENGSPLILFAGEATHRDFYSTTHGAYLSGQREAKRIVDLIKSKS